MAENIKNEIVTTNDDESKNVILVNEDNNTEDKTLPTDKKKTKKEFKFWKKYLRPAVVSMGLFMLVLGIGYPVVTTMVAQTIFPVQANGSQITVTLEDGTQRVYGSELVGQQFDRGYYLLGRDNSATTNLSPAGIDLNYLVAAREERLVLSGYRVKETREVTVNKNGVDYQVRHYFFMTEGGTDIQIPDLLLTASGSGIDPDITDSIATWQADMVYQGRNAFYTEDGSKRLFEMGADQAGQPTYGVYELKADDPNYNPDDDPESYLSLRLDANGMPTLREYTGVVKTFGLDDDGNPVEYTGNSVAEARANKGSHEYTKEFVERAIAKYTKPRWLYMFGNPTTNVLCVNLALDGLLAI